MFATGNHDMEPLYGNTEFLGDSPTHGYGGHAAAAGPAQERPEDLPVGLQLRLRQRRGHLAWTPTTCRTRSRPTPATPTARSCAWLEETLKDWRTNHDVAPTVDFIVAFFHHCAYSTTNQPRLRRRRARRARPAVHQVPGRPGRAGPQPHLRAHRPDQERPADAAGTGRVDDPTRRRTASRTSCVGSGGRPALPVPPGAERRRARRPPESPRAARRRCPRVSATAGTSPPGGPNTPRTTPRTSSTATSGRTDGHGGQRLGLPGRHQGARGRQLVAGPLRRLRLHRRRRGAGRGRPAHDDDHPHPGRRLPGTNAPYTEIDRITLSGWPGDNAISGRALGSSTPDHPGGHDEHGKPITR